MTDKRRVFLAPFAHPLAGRWVDACDAEEELERLQEKWGDVDFGAMDSEGFGEAIEQHGDSFVAFLRFNGGPAAQWTVEDAVAQYEEEYVGQYDSTLDFAEEVVDSYGYLDAMPESLRSYFDYAAFARDLMMDHYEQDGFYFRFC